MKKIRKIKNACAAVALCHASGIDEETVLRVCISAGFDKDDGMAEEEWQEAAEDLGIKIRKVSVDEIRLRKFVKEFDDGLYLVTTYDHILCVDGGIVFDPREKDRGHWPGLGRIVKGAWKVEK